MPFSRREFLGSTAAAGIAGLVRLEAQRTPAERRVFRHGVASGDPLADRVILWTRVTRDRDAAPEVVLGGRHATPTFTRIVVRGERRDRCVRATSPSRSTPAVSSRRRRITTASRRSASDRRSAGRERCPRRTHERVRLAWPPARTIRTATSTSTRRIAAARRPRRRAPPRRLHLRVRERRATATARASAASRSRPRDRRARRLSHAPRAVQVRSRSAGSRIASIRSSSCGTTTRSRTTRGGTAPRTTTRIAAKASGRPARRGGAGVLRVDADPRGSRDASAAYLPHVRVRRSRGSDHARHAARRSRRAGGARAMTSRSSTIRRARCSARAQEQWLFGELAAVEARGRALAAPRPAGDVRAAEPAGRDSR